MDSLCHNFLAHSAIRLPLFSTNALQLPYLIFIKSLNVVYQYLAHISTSHTFPDPHHFGIGFITLEYN